MNHLIRGTVSLVSRILSFGLTRMKIHVFEGIRLLVVRLDVRVDTPLKLSLSYTFVSKNMNSESYISAVDIECIVVHRMCRLQLFVRLTSSSILSFLLFHRRKTQSIYLFQSSGLIVLWEILPFFNFSYENIDKSYFFVEKVSSSQIK